ncbi:MAG: hypothetical protein LW823_08730 [Rickettsiales bacterium]|jgi:hypothetical protein|nr:hypothetical protein [Rickettsiales bacterium]
MGFIKIPQDKLDALTPEEKEIMRKGQIASYILHAVDSCGQHRLEYSPSSPGRKEILMGYLDKLEAGTYEYEGRKEGNPRVTLGDIRAEGWISEKPSGEIYLKLSDVLDAFFARREINIRLAEEIKNEMGVGQDASASMAR